MSEAILQLENLERRYRSGAGELIVLDHVDLVIAPGEVVGLVGPSGSGKSSLLHAAGLLEGPTDGSVRIAGESGWDYGDDERTRLRRAHIGFVYQFHHLLPEFSALDNVALPGLIAGRPPGAARAEAARLLGQMGLGERLDHRPAQLSGGEQQRVAIARALINRPKLILADEPTGNLDPETSRAVFDAMAGLVRNEGAAALIATHNFQLAKHMDRVIGLRQGRLVEIKDAGAADFDPWADAEMAQASSAYVFEDQPAGAGWSRHLAKGLDVSRWVSRIVTLLLMVVLITASLIPAGAMAGLLAFLSHPMLGRLRWIGAAIVSVLSHPMVLSLLIAITVVLELFRATTQHMFGDSRTAHLYPWARFWAKVIDLSLYFYAAGIALGALNLAIGFAVGVWILSVWSTTLIALFVTTLAFPLADAAAISLTGSSPGRALFRFSVLRPNGARPAFGAAFSRAWTCLFFGLGLTWLTFFTGLASYSHLLDRGSSLWDRDAGTEVRHKGPRWWSWSVPLLIIALYSFGIWRGLVQPTTSGFTP